MPSICHHSIIAKLWTNLQDYPLKMEWFWHALFTKDLEKIFPWSSPTGIWKWLHSWSKGAKLLLNMVTNLVLSTWYELHRHARSKGDGIMNASCKILAKAWEFRHTFQDYLLEDNDIEVYEAVSVKRKFHWRPKNVGYGRNMECLPGKTIVII